VSTADGFEREVIHRGELRMGDHLEGHDEDMGLVDEPIMQVVAMLCSCGCRIRVQDVRTGGTLTIHLTPDSRVIRRPNHGALLARLEAMLRDPPTTEEQHL